MATIRFEGGAAKATNTYTFAFGGTWEADDLIRVQVGNKIKDITAGSTTTATVVTNVVAGITALSSSDYPEMVSTETGFTASGNSTTLTLTANTAGVPFTATLTPLEANGGAADAQEIEGAGTATTGTQSVANGGPEVFDTAANWSSGSAPANGDTLHIDNYTGHILYGLSQASLTPAAVYFWRTFEGFCGLPKTNSEGTDYPEYRTDYLTIGTAVLDVGRGDVGQGSGRIKVSNGSTQCAVMVHSTGSREESAIPSFLFVGTHSDNTFTAVGDSDCGIAFFGGETSTIATLNVGGNASVICGVGVTLTTINVDGGQLLVQSNIGGTLTARGGEVRILGTATAAQLTLRGGTVVYNSTGTISGNTVLTGNAVLDFSQGMGSVTVSNPIELYGPDCRILDPNKRIASLVVDYNEGASDGQVDYGVNVRLTRGTPA